MGEVTGAPAGFCDRAWAQVEGLVDAIAGHPFNRHLEDGTLDPERFAFYLAQDARYLVGFARALSTASARSPDPDDAAFLAGSARTALAVERSLHSEYLAASGVAATDFPLSPTCLAYSSYLQAAAFAEPYPVAVAALLPCFWVYHHVGTGILERGAGGPGHPYQRWIATYGAPEFAESTATMREVVDGAARGAGRGGEEAMLEAFVRAAEYEWMFWESAWLMERWPTSGLVGTAGQASVVGSGPP
ncbi:MAG TPA: TenA family protein [Acidimicrobiales bacterium]|nr:TenA family protein [Acidimicrobiales bacterium]